MVAFRRNPLFLLLLFLLLSVLILITSGGSTRETRSRGKTRKQQVIDIEELGEEDPSSATENKQEEKVNDDRRPTNKEGKSQSARKDTQGVQKVRKGKKARVTKIKKPRKLVTREKLTQQTTRKSINGPKLYIHVKNSIQGIVLEVCKRTEVQEGGVDSVASSSQQEEGKGKKRKHVENVEVLYELQQGESTMMSSNIATEGLLLTEDVHSHQRSDVYIVQKKDKSEKFEIKLEEIKNVESLGGYSLLLEFFETRGRSFYLAHKYTYAYSDEKKANVIEKPSRRAAEFKVPFKWTTTHDANDERDPEKIQ